MSGVIKINKSSLDSSIVSFSDKVKEIEDDVTNVSNVLASIPAHDDFPNLTSKASMVARSLANVHLDLNHMSKNLKNYIEIMKLIDYEGFDVTLDDAEKYFDTDSDNDSDSNWGTDLGYTYPPNNGNDTPSDDSNNSSDDKTTPSDDNTTPSDDSKEPEEESKDNPSTDHSDKPESDSSIVIPTIPGDISGDGKYNYEGIEEYLEDVKGTTVTLPEGLGSIHTYMGWQCITAKSSNQYKLREAAGMNFDEEGFAKIGDRYVVATTTTFGKVGDFIDVYQEDGTVIKCVIGDIKSRGDAGCTEWGHNNGRCVVEFVVDKSKWYGSSMHANPGTLSCHPEWNQNIDKIVNKGNFFELITTDAAKFEKTYTSVEQVTDDFVKIATSNSTSDKFEVTGTTSEAYSSEFVSYCAEKSGFVEAGVIPKYSKASEAVDWFKENSTFANQEYEPKAGDIAFYDTDGDGAADYSAIIISTSGNRFTTIENNVTDNIRQATYTTNNTRIVGYGVPDYSVLLEKEEGSEEAK